jgi:hypothetical protein
VFIRSGSCPLATAVAAHPEVCQLTEALLAEIIGARSQGVATMRVYRNALSRLLGNENPIVNDSKSPAGNAFDQRQLPKLPH